MIQFKHLCFDKSDDLKKPDFQDLTLKRTYGSILFILIALFALSSCGPSLQKKKDEAKVHYELGVVHMNERNMGDALRELSEAVRLNPDDPAYHNTLGLAYFARDMRTEAIREMEKAIALSPKYSEAHVNLSAIYVVERKWDQVIEESGLALSNIFYKTPEFAYFNMGWAYYNKGDYPKALESFKKAVEANPNYSMAYYDMGLTYEKLNKVKDSIDAYRKAVENSPDYADAHFSLGLALVKQKDKAAALKEFEKVIEIAPESDKAKSAREYINLLK